MNGFQVKTTEKNEVEGLMQVMRQDKNRTFSSMAVPRESFDSSLLAGRLALIDHSGSRPGRGFGLCGRLRTRLDVKQLAASRHGRLPVLFFVVGSGAVRGAVAGAGVAAGTVPPLLVLVVGTLRAGTAAVVHPADPTWTGGDLH